MFRPALRQALRSSTPRTLIKAAPSRRFLSTAPPHEKSRTWKNSALRWGLAGALVYYYNTSPVFAEEPAYAVHAPPETQIESETLPTIDSVTVQRRSQAQSARQSASPVAASTTTDTQVSAVDAAAPGSPDELEEEASQQGAFNEETGEINWDCPCLGGMAHGPCGEQFREAFSCFIYSKEEPKGVDCIDKFKNMQNCFREHPEIYGSELDEDETAGQLEGEPQPPSEGKPVAEGEHRPGDAASPVGAEPSEPETSGMPSMPAANPRAEKVGDFKPGVSEVNSEEAKGRTERARAALEQVKSDHPDPTSESAHVVSKTEKDEKTPENTQNKKGGW